MTKEEESKPCCYEHLVLDAGPLMTAHLHASLSSNYWTVPEVLSEIRDPATKARLTMLPFELKTRQPGVDALGRVIEFAKGTGDYATLSKPDLLLMALTLELEEECNGKIQAEEVKPPTIHEGGKSDILVGVDDEDEWITPENLAQRKQRDMLKLKDQKAQLLDTKLSVACMTSDFAIQNVLMQMRLGVASLDGLRIKVLKTHMLRCHACYAYTSDMSKQFCPKCGGPTLIKTSYALDAEGKPHFYLAKNFQYRIRGTKFGIPIPKGGRQGEMILREDQREYQRALKTQKRAEAKEFKSLLNGGSAGVVADVDERLAGLFGDLSIGATSFASVGGGLKGKTQHAPRVTIGTGRRNPNEVVMNHRRK